MSIFFCVIALLKTISKFLERVVAYRFAMMAHCSRLVSLQQYGSFQTLLCVDTVTTIISKIKSYQYTSSCIFTLFLDIKRGSNNIIPKHIKHILEDRNIPQYLVNWVIIFIIEREVSLLFQGASDTTILVERETPPGLPSFSTALLYLCYMPVQTH